MDEDRRDLDALDQINNIRQRAGLPPLSRQEFLAMGGSFDDPSLNFSNFTGNNLAGMGGSGQFHYGMYQPITGALTMPAGDDAGNPDATGSLINLGDSSEFFVPSIAAVNYFGQGPTGATGQFTTDDILVTASEQPNMYDTYDPYAFTPVANPFAPLFKIGTAMSLLHGPRLNSSLSLRPSPR